MPERKRFDIGHIRPAIRYVGVLSVYDVRGLSQMSASNNGTPFRGTYNRSGYSIQHCFGRKAKGKLHGTDQESVKLVAGYCSIHCCCFRAGAVFRPAGAGFEPGIPGGAVDARRPDHQGGRLRHVHLHAGEREDRQAHRRRSRDVEMDEHGRP